MISPKIFFIGFLFFFFNVTLSAQYSGDTVTGITLPKWAKYARFSNDKKYYIVQTNNNHFGVVNQKLHLVTDTIFRNYCQLPIEMPDGKTMVYFMQKAAPGKTMYDFEGDWVMTNSKGKQINNLVFYKPYNLANTLFYHIDDYHYMCDGNGKWRKMNKDLKWVGPPQFDSMWCLQQDTLNDRTSFLVKANGKYGILDSGKTVVPLNYTKAIYALGGYCVILKNEKETVVYEPFTQLLWNFDSLLLTQSALYASQQFYYAYSTYYQRNFPSFVKQKMNLSQYLMLQNIYTLRLTNGENFSPMLYSPGIDYYEEKENYYYPFYQPKPAFIPWFHFLSSSADSNFFSYAYYYNQYDRSYSFGTNIIQMFGYNSGIFHYSFPKQDSITCVNYSVRGDSCYPITLDSIFRKDISYQQELATIFLDETKKYKKQLPEGDWTIYDHFYLTEIGITILFRCSEKDKTGNTQIYGMNFTWETLSSLIDPNGPLKNKIVVKPKNLRK